MTVVNQITLNGTPVPETFYSAIESLEVEGLDGLGRPQAQEVSDVGVVSGDGNVVGDAANHVLRDPADTVVAMLVVEPLGVSTSADVMGDFGAGHFPRVAERQPLVSLLHLPAILNFLREEAEFVANAVTDRRHVEGGERLQVAGGKAAQTAVAESGLGLMGDQPVDALAKF